jgi:hypothetical protein
MTEQNTSAKAVALESGVNAAGIDKYFDITERGSTCRPRRLLAYRPSSRSLTFLSSILRSWPRAALALGELSFHQGNRHLTAEMLFEEASKTK